MTIESELAEMYKLYIEESMEHLSDIENDLLEIEVKGSNINEDIINKVFRAVHSIKGGAGYLGLNNIINLSHHMENIIGLIRNRELIPNSDIMSAMLMGADALRNLIVNIEQSQLIDISEYIQALDDAINKPVKTDKKENVYVLDTFSHAIYDSEIMGTVFTERNEGKFIYELKYDLNYDVQMKKRTIFDLFEIIISSGNVLDCWVDTKTIGFIDQDIQSKHMPILMLYASNIESEMLEAMFEMTSENIKEADDASIQNKIQVISSENDIIKSREDSIQKEVIDFIDPKKDEIDTESSNLLSMSSLDRDADKDSKKLANSLRVNVELLDTLMTLAGEFVLSRNQLLQAVSLKDYHIIEAASQRIDFIASELQEAVMQTRMQPIITVFNKFPRVVRDLGKHLGKKIKLITEGKDVELDKTIIEAISDPLTHLIRNSVDHGIETPDERKKNGKDEIGLVILKAYHEMGQVNIQISDDGKGIDPDELMRSALQKGLITEKNAKLMSEKEKVNLIFLPGFSTAKALTDISGRGVGMDVVKTNLDKLGGVIDVQSTLGKGTKIWIKLPLTLAIITSQIISTAGERFAIPQVNLEELIGIPADQVKDRIEKVGNADVVRLRGNLLPIIMLADLIGLERTYCDPNDRTYKKERRTSIADRRSRKIEVVYNEAEDGPELEIIPQKNDDDSDTQSKKRSDRRFHAGSIINVVVVSTGSLKYGLIVDKLHDSEEIVVKPLGRHLKNCKGYAGTTIMGDGKVALILDIAGLAQMAKLTSVEGISKAIEVIEKQRISENNLKSILVFNNSEDEHFGVFLHHVERIEQILKNEIEYVGGRRVIKYRGKSLPLFAIEDVADVKPIANKDELLVLVFVVAGRKVGLMASLPIDSIESNFDIDPLTFKQAGILGSTIIENRTTLIVDMDDLIRRLNPKWFD
ncbi:MAG: chemotaxis protein CheW, partial [Desulfobacterales bacterium]|nr:chemotaxis protein CheW [Desulfobacterales bacterium]